MNYFIMPGLKYRPRVRVMRKEVVQNIITMACKHFGVTRVSLRGRGRYASIVWPRQVCMFLIKEKTSATYEEIGQLFSRDHTTAMASVAAVKQRVLAEELKSLDVEAIKSLIR